MEEAYSNFGKSLKEEESCYDRMKELKAFDDTKAGVKGLADSGLLKLPRIFVLPPEKIVEEEKLIVLDNSTCCGHGDHETVPVIDLQGMENQRTEIVDEVRRASETMGFFQLLNHGIPKNVMEKAMKGLAGFHEQDSELKKKFYTRELSKRVKFYSNVDFYQSDSARWQDTLNCAMLSPDPVDPRELPDVCSNDRFKSVPHRVVSSGVGPRISVASFFAISFIKSTKLYGPIKELITNGREHKGAHALVAFKM
ncbi:hypothetical protein MKW98_026765 [Papaver atlanticum]|uniref:Non-haem dioxygenase N-terminal domain-containing protein n=1 Tax=Papaver atlanticum TaxID=357466 RepID=A0AAD4S0C2_9MAGN|nr:hypothetical protein MKW98_026765 [Papaver atlanticum]